MRVEFFYFMICFLIPRLILQWRDHPRRRIKISAYSILAESILLIPLINKKGIIILLLFLITYHFLCFLLERKRSNLFPGRIIEFFLIFTIGSFLFGIFPEALRFNQFSQGILTFLIQRNVIMDRLDMRTIRQMILYFFGSLTLVNETNNLIRYILGLIKTEPHVSTKDSGTKTDKKELGRGKIIGIIERLLFFLFVLTGHYSSIAFILAAKGFTRFKALDDKNFAEYVLIGTLLSSAVSIFWAFLIGQMAQII